MACEYLIVNGAKINIQDQSGKTPLHLAVESGKKSCFYLCAGNTI